MLRRNARWILPAAMLTAMAITLLIALLIPEKPHGDYPQGAPRAPSRVVLADYVTLHCVAYFPSGGNVDATIQQNRDGAEATVIVSIRNNAPRSVWLDVDRIETLYTGTYRGFGGRLFYGSGSAWTGYQVLYKTATMHLSAHDLRGNHASCVEALW